MTTHQSCVIHQQLRQVGCQCRMCIKIKREKLLEMNTTMPSQAKQVYEIELNVMVGQTRRKGVDAPSVPPKSSWGPSRRAHQCRVRGLVLGAVAQSGLRYFLGGASTACTKSAPRASPQFSALYQVHTRDICSHFGGRVECL